MTPILYCLLPLILHFALTSLAALLCAAVGNLPAGSAAFSLFGTDLSLQSLCADTAFVTSLGALLSIPVLGWMWRQDLRKKRALAGQKEAETEMLRASLSSEAVALSPGKIMTKKQESKGISCARYVFLLLAGAAVSYLAGRLMSALGVYEHLNNATQQDLLSSPLAVQLIGLGILVPIAEELTYRGLLYERLQTQMSFSYKASAMTRSRIVSAILVAGIFAVLHGNLIQMLYAFPLSFLLTAAYEWTGSLWGAIVFHMGANLITVLLSSL